jgi:hypothetical protein
MLTLRFVFSQLIDFLPAEEFDRCIGPQRGARWMLGFSCRDEFLCFAYVQLKFRESLRAVATCLQPGTSVLTR